MASSGHNFYVVHVYQVSTKTDHNFLPAVQIIVSTVNELARNFDLTFFNNYPWETEGAIEGWRKAFLGPFLMQHLLCLSSQLHHPSSLRPIYNFGFIEGDNSQFKPWWVGLTVWTNRDTLCDCNLDPQRFRLDATSNGFLCIGYSTEEFGPFITQWIASTWPATTFHQVL